MATSNPTPLRDAGAALPEIYEPGVYDPRTAIAHLMGRLRAEMLSTLDRELETDEQLAQWDLTGAQFIIIASLTGSSRSQSASDLCKALSYDAGAMTRMIDRPENKGLIRRERCPDDRRLVYLELTEEGRAAYPRMREISRRGLNRFLRGFTKAEAHQLEAFLCRMLENA
ncbi:MAG: MarR family transcriptional regulator [Steroidobacteraceae bacterium]